MAVSKNQILNNYFVVFKLNTMSRYPDITAHMRKSIKTQIASKTQIALKILKNYEQRQEKMNQKILRNHTQFSRQIDTVYNRIHPNKQLKEDKNVIVQILPYNQEYFCIDTNFVLFPVRLFITNVRNDGVLLIGYDKQPFGINEDLSYPYSLAEQSDQKKGQFYKYNIAKDVMIPLYRSKNKKNTSKIYLTFSSKKQLFMFNIKFDHIGFQGFDDLQQKQESMNKIKRSKTECKIVKLKNTSANQSEQKNKFSYNRIENRGESPQSGLKSYLVQSILPPSSSVIDLQHNMSMKTIGLFNQPQLLETNQQRSKNFMYANMARIQKHRREKSRSFRQLQKQKSIQKQFRIKANKQNVEESRQKQLCIKKTAAIFKRQIENYQKLYDFEEMGSIKLCRHFVPFLYLIKFVQRTNTTYNDQLESLTAMINTQCIVNKFVVQIRKKYSQNILIMPSFKSRNRISIFHCLRLETKFVIEGSKGKAIDSIYNFFSHLTPAMRMNYALKKASKYRRCVRLIQKRWKIKHKARFQMLLFFGNQHVQKMFREYPHLKQSLNKYKSGNYGRRLCYQYLVDESSKFRHIYGAYSRRVIQIDQFIDENQKIYEYNKGKPQKKHKKYLDIPHKPYPPQQRNFRNLDILKSMIRGWFEMEYKIISKKNIFSK